MKRRVCVCVCEFIKTNTSVGVSGGISPPTHTHIAQRPCRAHAKLVLVWHKSKQQNIIVVVVVIVIVRHNLHSSHRWAPIRSTSTSTSTLVSAIVAASAWAQCHARHTTLHVASPLSALLAWLAFAYPLSLCLCILNIRLSLAPTINKIQNTHIHMHM